MQTFKTSIAKENILGKIRKSLSVAPLPIPFPEAEKDSGEIYCKSDLSLEETFAMKFIALGGKFVFCENDREFIQKIYALYDQSGWNSLLCADERFLSLFQQLGVDFVVTASEAIESANACITSCEMLVARTGSVMFSSAQHMGRTAPIYYPVHIIVAYTDQIASDLDEAFNVLKRKYGNDLPSMISVNSGPSRTADIEKTLVVGVHGPGEVFCFLINK